MVFSQRNSFSTGYQRFLPATTAVRYHYVPYRGGFGSAVHKISTGADPQKAKYITGTYENLSSVNERFVLWKKTLQMVKEHPLTGVGLSHWKLVIPRYGMENLRSAEGSTYFHSSTQRLPMGCRRNGHPRLVKLYIGIVPGHYGGHSHHHPFSSAPDPDTPTVNFGGIADFCRRIVLQFPPGTYFPHVTAGNTAGHYHLSRSTYFSGFSTTKLDGSRHDSGFLFGAVSGHLLPLLRVLPASFRCRGPTISAPTLTGRHKLRQSPGRFIRFIRWTPRQRRWHCCKPKHYSN